MTKNSKNLGNYGGPTPQHSDPTQRRRSVPRHRVPTLQCGPEGRMARSGVRRGVATIHSMEN